MTESEYKYAQRQLNITAALYVIACLGILGFFGWKLFA